jgi:hypothetical protein
MIDEYLNSVVAARASPAETFKGGDVLSVRFMYIRNLINKQLPGRSSMKIVIVSAICLILSLMSACQQATSRSEERTSRRSARVERNHSIPESAEVSTNYGPPAYLADLEDRAIDESSGIVASRRYSGLIWTHNDSGDGPFIYAFDRKGRRYGTWRVTGARAFDWEDIAAGPGPRHGQSYLYIGDIGDNDKERKQIIIYRVAEPAVTAADAATDRSAPQETEPVEAIHVRYPDGRYDAEALAVHPTTGDLYLITKTRKTTTVAAVYKLAAPFNTAQVNTLEKVGELRTPSLLPGMITGADISPDGRRIILCDYFNAFEMRLPDSLSGSFDEIWKQSMAIVRLGERNQGEAICYRLDGQAILATSETSPAALIEVETLKR